MWGMAASRVDVPVPSMNERGCAPKGLVRLIATICFLSLMLGFNDAEPGEIASCGDEIAMPIPKVCRRAPL
jgi:hypothetical protein